LHTQVMMPTQVMMLKRPPRRPRKQQQKQHGKQQPRRGRKMQ
jgi:hypothetical protein